MTRPLVIAHRGASGELLENTLPAFELAVTQRADMIELDLHLTRDAVVVVHHDASLARLGAPGEIADYTARELAALELGRHANGPLRIPTLVEVLDGFGRRIELNLEIKERDGRGGAYEGIEEIALDLVEARGLLSRMLFSSFSDAVLERIRARSREARIGVLVAPRAPWRVLSRARRVAAEAIHPHVAWVTAQRVQRAHAKALHVYPYTEDDPIAMARLLDRGVDGIMTNYPTRLWSVLRVRGIGSPAAAP